VEGKLVEINKRIKEIRKALGMTQVQFSDRLGIRQSSLSAIESGETGKVDERNIRIICTEFNVNEEWIRNGAGEMFNSSDNLMELLGSRIKTLTETDKKIITEYLKLTPKQRKSMIGFIKRMF
jgi:transcriptional regulator with XRE-family HTH domain